jgi:hypothetical protein
MTSRVFDVSFRNEARRVTVNDNNKIGHFIEKSIGIYDLNIDDISGIYFVDNDNQEIFLNDSIYTKFFDTISVFLRQYSQIQLFTITTSRHLRTPNLINKFRREYKRFITNNSQPNNRVFFDRPYMNVTNNYYGQQPQQDFSLNQLNTPITYYRAEMYVTNNYFNDQPDRPNERVSNPRPEPQPQPQPQVRIPEPDIINRIFNNNPANNANNIEIELNYLYNPERGQFNIIQNSPRNNIIDYIYNFITTTNATGVNQETINQLRRGTYANLREHIIPECTQCTISLEDFLDTTEVIVLNCRHAFTVDAIQRWLQTNTTCPTCRGDIVSPLTLPNRERFDTPPPIG